MNYFEGGFCAMQEYVSGESTRLMPEDLYVDELYVLMLALKKGHKHEALKTPSRILDMRVNVGGIYAVRFALLDNDLRVQLPTSGVFVGGYWTDAVERVVISHQPVESGYFKGFTDSFDDEWQSFNDSLNAKEPALLLS